MNCRLLYGRLLRRRLGLRYGLLGGRLCLRRRLVGRRLGFGRRLLDRSLLRGRGLLGCLVLVFLFVSHLSQFPFRLSACRSV